jgi:hypothetical protein
MDKDDLVKRLEQTAIAADNAGYPAIAANVREAADALSQIERELAEARVSINAVNGDYIAMRQWAELSQIERELRRKS